MPFYWNIMMYECEVEHKRFVCECVFLFLMNIILPPLTLSGHFCFPLHPPPTIPSLMLNLATSVVKDLSVLPFF